MNKFLKPFLYMCIIFIVIGIIIYSTQRPSRTGFQKERSFISSKTWTGKKNGYVFKRGDNGQGYYKDKFNKLK